MKKLPLPTDRDGNLLDAESVFKICVSKTKNPSLKKRLLEISTYVAEETSDYNTKASESRLHEKKPHEKVKQIKKAEMVKVYTLGMVPKTAAGREVYERIRQSPVNSQCPFCGIGPVKTLDHFLPKSSFPIFSVSPTNLVPACQWCQDEKREYFPKSDGEQLIHPYFDEISDEVWITAEVIETSPMSFRFFSDPPSGWSKSQKKRVSKHLQTLKLHQLYAQNAGSRLVEIRFHLKMLLDRGGSSEVVSYLQDQLKSAEAAAKNSWLTAMYRAAINSDWFCEGGFQS